MMSTTTAAIRLGQLRHALLVGCLLSGSAGAETLQQAWEAALTADRGLRAAQQNTAAAASLVGVWGAVERKTWLGVCHR